MPADKITRNRLESEWLEEIRKEMALQYEREKRSNPTNTYKSPRPFNVKTILVHLPVSGPGKVVHDLKTSYQRHYSIPGEEAALPREKGLRKLKNKGPVTTLPMDFTFPATSNAEYGWCASNSEKVLEKYGSTSTDPRETSKLIL